MKKTVDKPFNQDWFGAMANEFDAHVAKSIPMYSQFKTALTTMVRNEFKRHDVVLDLCCSTASLGRDIHQDNQNAPIYIGIDASPNMVDVADDNLRAFDRAWALTLSLDGSFYDGDYLVDAVDINTDYKFKGNRLVVEMLGFQFFTKSRRKYIQALRKNDNKSLILFEKCKCRYFDKNEELKDKYFKSLHFSSEEIKQKAVSVLSSMNDFMVQDDTLRKHLLESYPYVEKIFKAGNFVGYLASSDRCDFDMIKKYFSNPKFKKNRWNATKADMLE